METISATINIINICTTSYGKFKTLKDECRCFRDLLLVVKDVLVDVEEMHRQQQARGGRAENTKLGEPLRILCHAIKEGEKVLIACSKASKLKTAIFSEEYLNKLNQSTTNMNTALTLLTTSGLRANEAMREKVYEIDERVRTIDERVRNHSHEVADMVKSMLDSNAEMMNARFDELAEEMRSRDVVIDREDFKRQLADIKEEGLDFQDDAKVSYDKQLMRAVMDLSRQDSSASRGSAAEAPPPAYHDSKVLAANSSSGRFEQPDLRRSSTSVEDYLTCPISCDIMEDPVILTVSGKTYNREHLCKSLLAFPNLEPVTGEKYDNPLEYVENFSMRSMLMGTCGDSAFRRYDDKHFQSAYDDAWDRMRRKLHETMGTPCPPQWNEAPSASDPFDFFGGVHNAQHSVMTHQPTQMSQWAMPNAPVRLSTPVVPRAPEPKPKPARAPAPPMPPPPSQAELEAAYKEVAILLADASPVEAAVVKAKQILEGLPRSKAVVEGLKGLLYGVGVNVLRDGSRVETYFARANELGLQEEAEWRSSQGSWALFVRASQYCHGLQVEADMARAAAYYRRSADLGNPAAQYCIGFMLSKGNGVARNPQEAMRYYLLAADGGHSHAHCNIGTIHRKGEDVEKDEDKAIEHYWIAAEMGLAIAQYNLAFMFRKHKGRAEGDQRENERQAAHYYRLAADQGFADAMLGLGHMYFDGIGGARDYKTAVDMYRKAASYGLANAQFCLGSLLESGDIVTKDTDQAVRYYHLAADQQHASALLRLGEMYDDGEHVRRDPNEAVRFLWAAVDAGNKTAKKRLDRMYSGGHQPPVSKQQAVRQHLPAQPSVSKQQAVHQQLPAHYQPQNYEPRYSTAPGDDPFAGC